MDLHLKPRSATRLGKLGGIGIFSTAEARIRFAGECTARNALASGPFNTAARAKKSDSTRVVLGQIPKYCWEQIRPVLSRLAATRHGPRLSLRAFATRLGSDPGRSVALYNSPAGPHAS